MRPSHRPGGAVLALAAISAGLLGLAVSGFKPGLPPTLKADEPAYYLAAESLVHDLDLRLDVADRLRLFEAFPYFPAQNLIVMSDDGWRTLYYGKPYLYSFFAAPFVAVGGADGMLAFNMVLYVAMIWMGFLWLSRLGGDTDGSGRSEPLAALFVLGFFLASSSFAYVFWLHPEVLNMFAGFACLYWGLGAAGAGAGGRGGGAGTGIGGGIRRSALPLAASAAVLAAGVYNKPMLAALGLPVCFALLRRRSWAGLAVWLGSAALAILAYSGISMALTGHPTAYLVDLRAGLPLHDPYGQLVAPIPIPEPDPAAAEGSWAETVEERSKRGAGWWWILRLPEVRGFELAEDLPYFFFGRHTG
ncbi:MAG: hypothetical protein MI919_17000, partial [Holophagales bacterium]|nr:hypothetical protein [Holophagales bacterium]